ncbi:MAG TPA: hypothetical protein VFV38_05580 [Ktedonobacteraceae bacterium]|nr:hypothetical protein [Ktedonobacteraceae bacterium]
MDEREPIPPRTDEQHLEGLASRILIYSPNTAFQQLAQDYMRKCICWQSGVLFRYGYLGLQASEREVYLGGFTVNRHLFLLVPQSLYIQRFRTVLFEVARERLQIQDPTLLRAYCDLAVAEKGNGKNRNGIDHPAWDAEARARQISYWVALLARRKETQTPDWRW